MIGAVGLDRPFFQDKNRAFWLLQSFGWSGYLMLRYLTGVVNGFEPIVFLFHCLIITATGYSLTLLMAALYKRLIKLQAAITMLLSIVTVVLTSVLFSFLETWSISTFVNASFEPRGTQFLGALVLDFSLLAAWTALYYGINYYLLLEEQIDQRRALESQASSAQLAMLRYQLNPHFLFNTLNSISTLVLLAERERANAMLARLSSFLRYTLANEPTAQVPLAKEIDTLKLYLEIEKMRFEERLKPHFRIEAEAAGVPVPSLILQPLIENAIKYAVTPAEHGADIWITARREGDRVRIEVADSGAGGAVVSDSQSTGVGLANTSERLAQAYGDAGSFETRTNEKGGFSVILHIPFVKKDEA
ncbi:sensor histidine kinase [Sphingomicrobium astaxanthinifaciens]|uniref:sensor histidine kinase n=1 Tax=Sphingomicrobium astaxanthinifaciens TaxID=1227949 RepID=UPI001FCBEF06|nr:histidine kinase [Sphingomicrobium astaxanthinifaciens]MCJ7420979.1 histidine kinase [Sphingomicrobium astaxanthinifaciens]